ncbi:DsrE family protein [Helicobacter sp. MIT 05-5294]|uniref:DsrE family protein n=1 Tax=Helicobacter sp. MIT 05-5294 TaxID=1548150 RepID=UPI000B2BE34F|nr:DsrE family protein [Helicobacter sp. MIT 05-5294]TLD87872.1 hypothetical protein LS69_003555 [Helicobacter sp. MIT 05-5294]
MNKVLLLTNDAIGEKGELGHKLVMSFLSTLLTTQTPFEEIYLLNRAVLLATTNAEGIEVLKRLEEKGVKIYACQTCLGYFNVLEKLKVGNVGNMQGTIHALLNAQNVVSL